MPKKCILFLFLFVLSVRLSPIGFAETDITPPTTTKAVTPVSPDGNNGWYKQPVTVQLTATDLGSGVKEINYKVNTGSWQKASFPNSLNLIPNPSFETTDNLSDTLIQDWDITTPGQPQTSYTQDTTVYLPEYNTSSAKIESQDLGWHGINHATTFAPAQSYSNMSASVWIKTSNLNETAYFKIYAIYLDQNNVQQTALITQSQTLTATHDWTYLSTSFIVNVDNALGVYMDVGFDGTGTTWVDAASITQSVTSAQTSVTLPTDGTYQVEYFSVDQAGNIGVKPCVYPNCPKIKIDQTKPGDWQNAGAFRGLTGPAHYLWVYTNVNDTTSGLSTFTDKYQYKTDQNTTFGSYNDLSSCNGTWQTDMWRNLFSIPFFPGATSGYLLTQRTNFCNNNWSSCKYVKFYAEDMAGNSATKDYCINGPWVKVQGGGISRANAGINMIAEATTRNTDGLIESGNIDINFFDSSKRYEVKNSPTPTSTKYDELYAITTNKTTITSSLPASSGVYEINGNFTLKQSNLGQNYETQKINQIVFITGDLTIEKDMDINNESSILFIVKGNILIAKNINNIELGLISDNNVQTAYNANDENTQPLNITGLLVANTISFQRTLQGTNNTEEPSEIITYQPSLLINLTGYFKNNNVIWRTTQ